MPLKTTACAMVVAALLSACVDPLSERIAEFDTPTHRCGMIGNVDTGERVNGAPVYEIRCTSYFRKDGSATADAAKATGAKD